MTRRNTFERVKINPKSERLVSQLLAENSDLKHILLDSAYELEVYARLRKWLLDQLGDRSDAWRYYANEISGREVYSRLKWHEYGVIRLLDYIDHEGMEYEDPNLRGERYYNHPIRILWMAATQGKGGAKPAFFEDMIHLFRQIAGKSQREYPDKQTIKTWMERHPSGLDPEIVRIREENRDRILNILIRKLDSGEIRGIFLNMDPSLRYEEKFRKMLEWWNSKLFHLKMAVRSPELLNEMLDYSLDADTMDILYQAREAGIPFFVNPYYLSLLDTRKSGNYVGADQAIRDYMIYSKQLVDEFGHITAWEKEDQVEYGKPNIAGWYLPEGNNIHRRYPDVAILIPDSMGRACGGLCASCQRMFDFQSGNLNFDLDRLKPRETWPHKLNRLMEYFRYDTQLRDILITGGDALMSTDKSLKKVLDAVYTMARNKKADNVYRADGNKYAEILRVRLGTRLPIYLPQRIDDQLANMLAEFKEKASKVGIKQFIIQTHFETAMEITPLAKQAVEKLISAGWVVTNQQVFTAAASRRGHTAKLRKVLSEIGVLPYYTFSVKGFMENQHNFATNARSLQEQTEEKHVGVLPNRSFEKIKKLSGHPKDITSHIRHLLEEEDAPFIGTDRNVLNMPGVGKSLTYRVVGVTREGRRILSFDHDHTRRHSPVIDKMGNTMIVESKSISDYMKQLDEMGEDITEYKSIWGYSMGETEERMPLYDYPEYDLSVTQELSNFALIETEISP